MFVTGNGNNRTGWSDPVYDRLIREAAKETDPTRRFEILRRAEAILVSQQVPVCPIFYYVGIQLYDPRSLEASSNLTSWTSIPSRPCIASSARGEPPGASLQAAALLAVRSPQNCAIRSRAILI